MLELATKVVLSSQRSSSISEILKEVRESSILSFYFIIRPFHPLLRLHKDNTVQLMMANFESVYNNSGKDILGFEEVFMQLLSQGKNLFYLQVLSGLINFSPPVRIARAVGGCTGG